MPMLDLGHAAREVTRLLDGVTDDQLSDPTTCPGTSVAGMLDHMMGFSLAFLWAARKEIPEGGGGAPQADAANLDREWRTVLPQRVSELAEAWRDPAAWEGMTEAGGVTMPGEAIGMVALDELVMHGWDLARATGQSFTCDPGQRVGGVGLHGAHGRAGDGGRPRRVVRAGRERTRGCARLRPGAGQCRP